MTSRAPLFLLLCLFCTVSTCLQAGSPAGPNIVVINIDDLGYGDIGCYGATAVETPNVDRLARDGLRFTDAHCPASTCTPSRYSLLTGRYAFRSGAAILPGDAPLIIPPGTPTLASMLKQHGYATAVVGKWHLGVGDGNTDWNGKVAPGPLEIGFDHSYIIPSTPDRVPCVILNGHYVEGLDPLDPIQVSYGKRVGNDPTGKSHPELLRQPADAQHSDTIVNGISRIGYMSGGSAARWNDETLPHQLLREARAFIRENRKQPFFLYYAYYEIHDPNLPDYRFQGATDMGPRGDSIAQMDWATGQLLDYLEELGLKENTLVIFTSDNGPVLTDGYEDGGLERLGDHKPAGPLRGGKYSAFEAGTRVPFIVSWPGTIKAGVRDTLVGQVDLYASIARLVEHKREEGEASDSIDTLDAFMGNSSKGRQFLLQESYTLGVRTKQYKYIQPVAQVGQNWIESQKNIESGLSIHPQLYDLSVDEGETTNLAAGKPDVVEQMERELRRLVDHPQCRH